MGAVSLTHDFKVGDRLEATVTFTSPQQCEILAVQLAACNAIAAVMGNNVEKHPPAEWRTEALDSHVHKAKGHLERYTGIKEGWREPDGEDHLAQALVRVAMALGVRG